MDRRGYLRVLSFGGIGALTGCSELLDVNQRSVQEPPLLEDRPDAVYVPTHIEGMNMVRTARAGRLRLELSYSFPHRFWLVNGNRTNKVSVKDTNDMHLMVRVWDGKTKTVIPSSTTATTITRNGGTVVDKKLWPMLSQNMGFHYGDNITLGRDDSYAVKIRFGPVGVRKTGDLQGVFDTQTLATFSIDFNRSSLEDISFKRLQDRQGQRDALSPMNDMSIPQLPPAKQLPGSVLGTKTSSDAKFVVTVTDSRPSGIDGSGPYLTVSPRTPYNRYPLPFMSLSATLKRDGERLLTNQLTQTLDPERGYHYGTPIESIETGDTLTITPQTPPQVSRHEGYETAFLNMSPMEFSVTET